MLLTRQRLLRLSSFCFAFATELRPLTRQRNPVFQRKDLLPTRMGHGHSRFASFWCSGSKENVSNRKDSQSAELKSLGCAEDEHLDHHGFEIASAGNATIRVVLHKPPS